MELRETILPIDEWLASPYHLGAEVSSLKPYWRDKLVEYFCGDARDYIFSGSQRSGKCVSQGTFVRTADGVYPIETLMEPPERPDCEGVLPLRSPVSVFVAGMRSAASAGYYSARKPVVRLTFSLGPGLSCTEVHPLFVWNPRKLEFEWCRASSVKVGDVCVLDAVPVCPDGFEFSDYHYRLGLSSHRESSMPSFGLVRGWSAQISFMVGALDAGVVVRSGIPVYIQDNPQLLSFVENLVLSCGVVTSRFLHGVSRRPGFRLCGSSERWPRLFRSRVGEIGVVRPCPDYRSFSRHVFPGMGRALRLAAESRGVRLNREERSENNWWADSLRSDLTPPTIAKARRFLASKGVSVDILPDGWYPAVVKDVKISHDECYDLTVPGLSSFLGNGVVCHNTYASCIIMLRYVYEMGCFVPGAFPQMFGLSPTTLPKLYFMSFTRAKATSAGIDRLIRMVDSIPWFNTALHRRRPVTGSLEFPWVVVNSGMNASHVIGEDLLGCVVDEASIRHVAKAREVLEAEELLMEIRMRSRTTFSVRGRWLGFTGIIATAGSTTSFVDSQIQQAKTRGGDKFIAEASVYDVDPSRFSKETFRVFPGSSDVRPFIVDSPAPDILSDISDSSGLLLGQWVAEHADDFLDVPVDLRVFYEENIQSALSNLSGVSMASVSNLFRKASYLDSMFDRAFLSPQRTVCPDMGVLDPFHPSDLFDLALVLNEYQGEPVFVHYDLSLKSDYTGVAFVYLSETTRKIQPLLLLSAYYNTRLPDNEISQEAMVSLLHYMVVELGVNVCYLTADQFQSAYLLQQARLLLGSSRVGHQSVDTSADGYLNLLSYVRRGMLRFYPCPKLRKELSELVYDSFSGKVDHPVNPNPAAPRTTAHDLDGIVGGFYSKDLSDAVASACWSLRLHLNFTPEEVVLEGAAAKASRRISERDFYGDAEMLADDGFYSDMGGLDGVSDEELFDASLYDGLGLDGGSVGGLYDGRM